MSARFTKFSVNKEGSALSEQSESKGFTLIELLVVISIIAVLSAVGLVSYNGIRGKAMDARIKSDLNSIKKAYESNYDPTANNGQGGYKALSPTQFVGGSIPVQPNSSAYYCPTGPGSTDGSLTCTIPSTQGYKIMPSAPLSDNTTPSVISNAGTLNSTVNLNSCDVLGTLSGSNSGLIGYWKMDDAGSAVADSSGSTGGTWQGTPLGGSQWKPGKIGGAANFNGTDNYIDTSNNPIAAGDSITFGGWFQPDSTGNGFVFSRGADGSGAGWSIYLLAKGGSKAEAAVVTTNPGIAQYTATGTTTLVTGTWYHIMGVWIPGSNVNIYVNGLLEGTSPGTAGTNLRTSTVNIRFGVFNAITSFYKGLIDEFRIYKRVLSGPEIALLWNNGTGCAP